MPNIFLLLRYAKDEVRGRHEEMRMREGRLRRALKLKLMRHRHCDRMKKRSLLADKQHHTLT